MRLRVTIWLVLTLTLVTVSVVGAQSGAAKGQGRVKGSVMDPQGKPVDGATIKFYSPRLETGFEIKTDEKGAWMVSGMKGGAWDIDILKEGFRDKKISAQITELSFNKPIEIQLEAQAAVQAAQAKEKTPGLDLLEEGNTLREAKDFAGAIAKYEAALQANPALNVVYGDIGAVYNEQGNADKAIESYKKFIELVPDSVEAKIELANIYLTGGKIDEAKTLLANIDLSSATNPYTIYNLGVGMYNSQMPEEAIKYWERTVALDPQMSDAYLQMGFAYYSIKNMAKAKEAFLKVVEIQPDSENARGAQEMLDTMK